MAKVRLKEHKAEKFSWIYVAHPTNLETLELGKRFDFEEIDLRDVLPPIQRPKLVERSDYLFMILLFPVYNREIGKIHSVEVDFFIGRDYLVTAVSEDLAPLRELFQACGSRDKKSRQFCEAETPAELIYEILSRLEQYCFPISTHISSDIDQVENEVFQASHKYKTINEVLRIKTNIVNFRKAMNRHTLVIQKFLHRAPRFFQTDKLDLYFKDLVERSEDLWQLLENYQDTIDAIHESQISLLNYRSNVIMEVFTIFTTIIFALELVISLITLGTETLPLSTKPLELGIALSGLFLTGLLLVIYFKRQRWIQSR